MIDTIYIEGDIANHPRTSSILSRYPNATRIECENYGEIFNRKAQNFRLQKKKPALILARKHSGHVLPTPKQYGIGAEHNYYFSHMLNCLYDCRYCFLQGMFESAHYVLFVNYEDYLQELKKTADTHAGKPVHFFSGYDCDSLALDPLTGFTEAFLPFFENNPDTLLELRTKSTQARSLLGRKVMTNCVVAFSFTPEVISRALEHKVPALEKRLNTMLDLQQAGWQIGLRFDPLIYTENYESEYRELIEKLLTKLDNSLIHSVSLGSFRLPKPYYRKLEKLYPDELLLASPVEEENNQIGYPSGLRDAMLDYCAGLIGQYVPANKFFPCHEMI